VAAAAWPRRRTRSTTALLQALRVAQELHEFLYAATHLQRWMYVPDAALPGLLRGVL
jgi:hypothetical protein